MVAAVAANGRRRGAELPRRDVPPITMTVFWLAVFVGLLVLCFGVLLGNSLTVQALDRQHRRQRRELNRRLRVQQQTKPAPHLVRQPDRLIRR